MVQFYFIRPLISDLLSFNRLIQMHFLNKFSGWVKQIKQAESQWSFMLFYCCHDTRCPAGGAVSSSSASKCHTSVPMLCNCASKGNNLAFRKNNSTSVDFGLWCRDKVDIPALCTFNSTEHCGNLLQKNSNTVHWFMSVYVSFIQRHYTALPTELCFCCTSLISPVPNFDLDWAWP